MGPTWQHEAELGARQPLRVAARQLRVGPDQDVILGPAQRNTGTTTLPSNSVRWPKGGAGAFGVPHARWLRNTGTTSYTYKQCEMANLVGRPVCHTMCRTTNSLPAVLVPDTAERGEEAMQSTAFTGISGA